MSTIAASAFLAFSIALPFGPVSLMCVQRSLFSGILHGLACGAGASTAHVLFAALAVFGAETVAGPLTSWQPLVHLISSAILVILGLRMMWKVSNASHALAAETGEVSSYFAGLTLALTNPATMIPYLALASSGLLIDHERSLALAATMTGVLIGSVAWYAMLSGSAWALKGRLPHMFLSRLRLLASVALIGMGLHLALEGGGYVLLLAQRN